MGNREYDIRTAAIVLAVGIVIYLLLLSIMILSVRKRKKRCSVTVSAVVAAFDYEYRNTGYSGNADGKQSRVTKPQYRFSYQGEDHYATDSIGVGGKTCKEGQIVQIRINPENPEECFGIRQMRSYYTGIAVFLTIPFLAFLAIMLFAFYTFAHPVE